MDIEKGRRDWGYVVNSGEIYLQLILLYYGILNDYWFCNKMKLKKAL